MDLLVLRHGKAEDLNPEGDFARVLVEKGRQQAEAVARVLERVGRLPQLVLTSPRVRARQTAERFCDVAGMEGPLSQRWLDCGMGAEDALRELLAFVDYERVMIVGHEPDLSDLVEFLLGCGAGSVEVKKGAVVGLTVHPPSWRASLRFLVPPKLLG